MHPLVLTYNVFHPSFALPTCSFVRAFCNSPVNLLFQHPKQLSVIKLSLGFMTTLLSNPGLMTHATNHLPSWKGTPPLFPSFNHLWEDIAFNAIAFGFP